MDHRWNKLGVTPPPSLFLLPFTFFSISFSSFSYISQLVRLLSGCKFRFAFLFVLLCPKLNTTSLNGKTLHVQRLPGLGFLRNPSGSNLHGCEARPEAIFWYHGRQEPLGLVEFLVPLVSVYLIQPVNEVGPLVGASWWLWLFPNSRERMAAN